MFGNSFKPIFVGKFHQKNGNVFLEGKFTTFIFSKIFMFFWLTFAAFWTLLAFFNTAATLVTDIQRIGNEPTQILFLIIGAAFFVIGILFIKGCWRLSSKDMEYLKEVICKALSESS